MIHLTKHPKNLNLKFRKELGPYAQARKVVTYAIEVPIHTSRSWILRLMREGWVTDVLKMSIPVQKLINLIILRHGETPSMRK